MKQKEFVKQSVLACMADGLTGEALTSSAVNQVTNGLLTGECDHSSPTIREDEKEARSYAKAVVGNYIKKDKDLNGGVKYVPKSTRGPIIKDPELKELKVVLKALEANKADTNLIYAVQTRIADKELEIEAAKTTSKLPSLDDAMAILTKLGIG